MGLFNKKTELIVSTDNLRENMCRVYFKNGFLYATNAQVALKQHLSLFKFTEGEINNLNGRSISLDDWLIIRKFKSHSATESGIFCKTKNTELFFNYKDNGFKSQKMVDEIENVFKTALELDKENQETFSLNSKLLNNISQAMFLGINKGLVFKCKGRHKAIILWSKSDEYPLDKQIGLIMPIN